MNQKDFKIFKTYVDKWRIALGVTDWQVSVDVEELEDDRDAQCAFDNQNRCARISSSKSLESPPNKFLEANAIHEVLELVMADIRVALNAYYNDGVVDQHIHRVIRRLENALK